MGWDGCRSWKTPKDARDELAAEITRSGAVVLAARGKWMLVENRGQVRAICVLVERHGVKGDTCLMRKVIGDESHPYYHDAPLAWLAKLSPSSGTSGADWQKGVRAHHARLSRAWKPGDACLIGTLSYTVEEALSGGYHRVRRSDGRTFRAKPKQMEPVPSEEASP